MLASAAEVALLHVSFRCRMLGGFAVRRIYTLMLPKKRGYPLSRRSNRHANHAVEKQSRHNRLRGGGTRRTDPYRRAGAGFVRSRICRRLSPAVGVDENAVAMRGVRFLTRHTLNARTAEHHCMGDFRLPCTIPARCLVQLSGFRPARNGSLLHQCKLTRLPYSLAKRPDENRDRYLALRAGLIDINTAVNLLTGCCQ